ncbi:MAG: hypothetical protein MPJ50_03610 [Pirellulales bacterium]|nr:hypothetical protein [Pirellulales bacterium]
MDQVQTWCQLFEERVNDWLDERRPLQAELFFDETPPEGAADTIEVPAILASGDVSPVRSGQPEKQHRPTIVLTYGDFVRQLRCHVENCASCRSQALGYGDLQQVIWSLQAPQPAASLMASALSQISREMQDETTVPSVASEDALLSAEQPELVPHLNTAGLVARRHEHDSSPPVDSSTSYASRAAISPGKTVLLRSMQLLAVAVTVLIAVTIAFYTPRDLDPADRRADNNSGETRNDGAAQPRRRWNMPSASLLFRETQEGFNAFNTMLPIWREPKGQLVSHAKVRSEAAWEEMSGGMAPLADSAQNSAGFLSGLIPLDVLANSTESAD